MKNWIHDLISTISTRGWNNVPDMTLSILYGKSRAAATGEATVDFSFNRSYDISGKKTAHIHHHDIVIPANATPGDYHLMVYCTDAAGNETYIARNIVLSTTAEGDDHHHDE